MAKAFRRSLENLGFQIMPTYEHLTPSLRMMRWDTFRSLMVMV